MSLKSFLAKLRRHDLSFQDLKVVGGPVDIFERVQVPFLPDSQTTPRGIRLQKSEDGRVHAILWHIGDKSFSRIFEGETEAERFYEETRVQLLEDAKAEATSIRARLELDFAESWKDARAVYFHRGFRVQAYFSYNDEKAKINRRLGPGLVRGPCPQCGTSHVFDAAEPFRKFLQILDNASEETFMPSHDGRITEVGIPAKSRCPNCFEYPNVSFTAQASRGLLKELKETRGGEMLE